MNTIFISKYWNEKIKACCINNMSFYIVSLRKPTDRADLYPCALRQNYKRTQNIQRYVAYGKHFCAIGVSNGNYEVIAASLSGSFRFPSVAIGLPQVKRYSSSEGEQRSNAILYIIILILIIIACPAASGELATICLV